MILCQKAMCGDYASWYPVFLLYAPLEYGSSSPIQVTLEMGFCNYHKSTAQLENLLDDKGWKRIAGMITSQGYVEPDPSLTKLAWKAIS